MFERCRLFFSLRQHELNSQPHGCDHEHLPSVLWVQLADTCAKYNMLTSQASTSSTLAV